VGAPEGEKGRNDQGMSIKRKAKTAGTFEVRIEKLVYGGSGLAHHEGKVVFVPFSVPGDRLLVRPVEEKKTFIRAEIVKVLKPGKGRVAPVCAHFARCGGCHWQQLEYSRQVEAKRQILEEVFYHRFPRTRDLPIVMRASAQPFAYRSRARIQIRGSGLESTAGFLRCGSHTVEDVDYCPLFRPLLNEALHSVRQFTLKVDANTASRELDMASSEEEDAWATARPEAVQEQAGTLLLGTGTGEQMLRRRVGEFTYFATASSFFQANDFIVPELVDLVRKCAENAGNASAIDLFAGVGLFSLPLARQFAEVIAVENSPSAVRLCSRNAKTAGLGNIQAVCADVGAWLQSREARARSCDLVVLDPPRTGAGPEVMEAIRELAPGTIVYVSCDPQTLARDLAKLSPRDYEINVVEGLDMFPQTYHFETVVRLAKNR